MKITQMLVYVLVMAAVTYAVRMLPLTLIRGKIQSGFIRSLLFYMPYAVLAAMIIPDILFSTDSVLSAAIGLAVAVLASLLGQKLPVVAVCSCVAVLVTELLAKLL